MEWDQQDSYRANITFLLNWLEIKRKIKVIFNSKLYCIDSVSDGFKMALSMEVLDSVRPCA